MADCFVQSFLAISEPAERSRALNGLVDALHFPDRQALCTIVHEKNDIVPRLPTELVLEVFSYLDLFDVWSLQLVNRRWRRMLSSEDFLRASLARWESHDPEDSARAFASDTIPEKIRHVQAFRHGKPFTQTTFDHTGPDWTYHRTSMWREQFAFCRDKIAYVSSPPGEGDTITLRDLVTGAAKVIRGSARERICMLSLTSSVVVFVNFDGMAYITQYSDDLMLLQTTEVQLPSIRIRTFGGQGDQLAFAMGGESFSASYVTSILTYNVQSQCLQAFSVDATQKELEGFEQTRNDTDIRHTARMLVNNAMGCIDLFTFCYDFFPLSDGRKLTLAHLRMSLDGEMQKSGLWKRCVPQKVHPNVHYVMPPPQPTGRQGEYRILIGEVTPHIAAPSTHKFEVDFDSRSAEFKPSEVKTRYCRLSGENRVVRQSKPTAAMYVQWKDLMITWDNEDPEWLEYLTKINDTFMVVLELSQTSPQRSRIRVFCFDEKIAAQVCNSEGVWDLEERHPAALIE